MKIGDIIKAHYSGSVYTLSRITKERQGKKEVNIYHFVSEKSMPFSISEDNLRKEKSKNVFKW